LNKGNIEMLRSLRIIAAGLLLGLMAACATPDGFEMRSMPGNNPQASAFNQALYDEYSALISDEAGENDWRSADMFARKAKAAAANGLVPPEDISAHPVHASETAALSDMQSRLNGFLDRGARELRPGWAAKAQANFDCAVEEASEKDPRGNVLEPGHVAACKAAFEEAMDKIEPFLPKPAEAKKPLFELMPDQVPPPAPVAVGVPETYLVFFDWNKADLTPEALGIVRTAAGNAKKAAGARIEVTGHADRSGSAEYNMGLSMRRAQAVKGEMVKQGVPAASISVFAKGETEPLVATPDGVREPQNRRAQIVIKIMK
jgi:OOP family OmpA-OmpF porin